uniref:Vitellogenin domain-containing protein n=1 Tax=Panagrolaimus sp. JU765 TaxID=591449 RepID=A0AC34RAH4_9BILA
ETLEGECQTVYIIDNSEDEETKAFNVTKSIDFRHCKKTPIIRYGPRPEKSNSETKQREIEEQQMDRSTVFRYQLVGSPENYGIGRVEIVSQYVYKVLNAETEQALNSVVLGELVFETMEKKSSKAPQTLFQSKEESLMYSTEWDKLQKRFFYFGDEEFTQKNSPFAKIHNKVQMIQELLQQLSRATADKINGIETETTLKMQQLVELVRMCSVKDLNKIHSEIQESEIQNGLLIDALAVAGTRNTIHFLIKEIRGQKMSAAKSVQVFQQLSGLPAPSTKQIDMVLDLCKSELVQDSVALSQSCWLTAGSMIGEICRENARDSVEDSEEQCTRHQKETFHKILMAQFRNAKTPFEKVIALKAIGNA